MLSFFSSAATIDRALPIDGTVCENTRCFPHEGRNDVRHIDVPIGSIKMSVAFGRANRSESDRDELLFEDLRIRRGIIYDRNQSDEQSVCFRRKQSCVHRKNVRCTVDRKISSTQFPLIGELNFDTR